MLFREFNIIAATAYAAHCAAQALIGPPDLPLWTELSEAVQGEFTEQVMAIARGEGGGPGTVFRATVRAILDHNDGQGGLALERIADLGQFLVDSELVAKGQAEQGGDIVDHAKELLQPLAELNALGVGFFISRPVPEVVEAEAEPEDETVQ